ncbi:hypothetical protein V865_003782 [Kwoniella europaea PYCC6329]|uniref:Uncharacterized protein n=1 Tax=Kwoniella europaea PYCC6329 TaxID=1423913 RepID=A0AAX4KH73_9TREE
MSNPHSDSDDNTILVPIDCRFDGTTEYKTYNCIITRDNSQDSTNQNSYPCILSKVAGRPGNLQHVFYPVGVTKITADHTCFSGSDLGYIKQGREDKPNSAFELLLISTDDNEQFYKFSG